MGKNNRTRGKQTVCGRAATLWDGGKKDKIHLIELDKRKFSIWNEVIERANDDLKLVGTCFWCSLVDLKRRYCFTEERGKNFSH